AVVARVQVRADLPAVAVVQQLVAAVAEGGGDLAAPCSQSQPDGGAVLARVQVEVPRDLEVAEGTTGRAHAQAMAARSEGAQCEAPRGVERGAFAHGLVVVRQHELRREAVDQAPRKGMTRGDAEPVLRQRLWFGAMMVTEGHAEGMVCGLGVSFPDTLRPMLQA